MLENLYPITGQTLSVANGADTFSIASIILDENDVVAGDALSDGASFIPIATVDESAGTGTLEFGWPGTTRSGYATWWIWRNPAVRQSAQYAAAQASKVSARQALITGQAVVWRVATETNTPWTDPDDGDRYLIGPAPTGAWAGKAGLIVERRNGQDVFSQAAIGDGAFILDSKIVKIWGGSNWTASSAAFASPAGDEQTVQAMLAAHPRQAIEFGILPGNTAAQNATAFTDMVDWININGGLVEFEAAEYTVNFASVPAITINGGGFIGQGAFEGGTVFRNASATGDTLTLDGAQHFVIRDIWFYPSVFRNAGTFEVTVTGAAYCCRVEHCRCDYAANGFNIFDASECEILNCQTRYMHDSFGIRYAGTVGTGSYRARIQNFKANNPYPTSVYGTVKAYAAGPFNLNDIVEVNGMVLQCVTAGTTGGTAPTTFPQTTPTAPFTTNIADGSVAWRFVCRNTLQWIVHDSYAYSLVIHKAAVLNGYRGFTQIDGAATGTSYPIWCWSDGLECDHSYAENVLLSGGEGFYASMSWFGSAMTGNGVTVGASHKGEVAISSGTRIAAAWLHGLTWAAGPRGGIIDDAFIGANSVAGSGIYHGISVAASAQGLAISGSHIGTLPGVVSNLQGYALVVGSGASNIRIGGGNNFNGNVTGKISAPAGSITGHIDGVFLTPPVFGEGGGRQRIVANGGNSGTDNGAAFIVNLAGALTAGFGNYSAIGSGTYNPDVWFYSSGVLIMASGGAERIRIESGGNIGVLTPFPNTQFDINGGVALRQAGVTLANGGNQNVSRPAFSSLRVTGPTAAFNIGGLTGGADGILAEVINTTSHLMTINNEDAGSTAGNRIITPAGSNLNCKTATLRYDATTARWRVISYAI